MHTLLQKTGLPIFIAVVLLLLIVAPVNAHEHTLIERQKAKLFKKLASAKNEQQGRNAEDAIWRLWFNQAPSAEIMASLDAGMERRKAYDFEAAESHLDKVIEGAPDYAQGYNQRAFVRFLRENYSNALSDLEIAIELEPNHFGAMSGMYHILRIQNRQLAAMKVLQQAVTIHPWLKERHALPENMWPDVYRDLHQSPHETGLEI